MSVVDRALHSTEVLRTKRAKLFKAFDIFKQNVNFGIEEITEERKEIIINWYKRCLGLDYDSIVHYPVELQKYIK